ncbi:apolipoprotein L1 [Xiphophorus hellerii]|uniref:apolipoprotein L1 n=1 Tax=Xiphophorus hellerii TaxID=8084 RepID=UPI0013B40CB6|nr:uncharacterized protein LOC116721971 [Xiphophorus hellerii]
MDRYDQLDLDLAAQKATLFGGVFRKSSKAAQPSPKAQDKSGMFGGILKRSPRPGQTRRPSQDLLDLSAHDKNHSEITNTKESAGKVTKSPKFNGMRAASKEDLSAQSELSKSNDSLSKTKEPSGFGAIFKNPFGARAPSQEDLSAASEVSESSENLSESHTEETGFFGGIFKKKVASSQSQKDTEDTQTSAENGKQSQNKADLVKSNLILTEGKEKGEIPPVLRRPRAEAMKTTSMHEMEKPKPEEKKEKLPREKKEKPSDPPVVPPRPSEEEMSKTVRHRKKDKQEQSQSGQEATGLTKDKPGASDDEGLKDEDESSSKEEIKNDDKEKPEKKPKHNPFMPRPQAASDDEGLKDKDESSIKEEIKKDGDKENMDKPKVNKPKKHNPFMPQIKAKVIQKNRPGGAAAENEEPQRSLFDRLEDFRMEPSRPDEGQDVEDLMDWWNNVESWEDTPQDDNMTKKEEVKAFAVTADKVQKGIRVFNKLFSERAESLWQHVIDLNTIADGLDKFNKKTKIAQITGGSTSAIGGVTTITGLALAPFTMGTSLIVTAVGLGVATAGGLTSAGAGISNQVNNSLDRKKVEKIVKDYQEKIGDLNKCLKFIKQGIENLRKFDLIKMKKSAYNQDFPALTSQFYEDGAMAGKAILINANEIMRVVQIANVAGSTAARAVQIASMATGVLTGLFVGMDIYFVAEDSKELKKGAKSEFAAKIREVTTQLHDGLVELNTIWEELHSTTPEGNAGGKEGESKRDK